MGEGRRKKQLWGREVEDGGERVNPAKHREQEGEGGTRPIQQRGKERWVEVNVVFPPTSVVVMFDGQKKHGSLGIGLRFPCRQCHSTPEGKPASTAVDASCQQPQSLPPPPST